MLIGFKLSACLFFLLCAAIQDCQSRSLTVVVRHRQKFSVRDIVKRSYIRLADRHEAELQLDGYRPVDTHIHKANYSTAQTNNVTVIDVPKYHMDDGVDSFSPDSEEHFYGGYDDDENIHDDEDDSYEIDADHENDDYVTSGSDDVNEQRGDNYDDEALYQDKQERFNKNLYTSMGGDLEDSIEPELDDDAIDDTAEYRSARRPREVQKQWMESEFGSGVPEIREPSKNENSEPDEWEVITDEELEKGKNFRFKETAEFLGITLLSVAGFAFIGICFIRDPVACVFAFGTGCPCCIIFCPCIRAFTDKYLNSKRLIRESMNTYMPGVIVKEDGSMDFYEPTPEEVEILHEIIEEMTG